MTRRRLVLLAWIFVFCFTAARAALAMDPGPLERHLRGLRSSIYKMSARSFVVRTGDGRVREQFTVGSDGYTYAMYDARGIKIVQWSKRRSGQITYEAWYSANAPKERLLEDDRSVSYTSFYRNGQKWEQYILNKHKRIRSYDVYDKEGRLVRS